MQISQDMIDHYLGFVTVHWFNNHDIQADNVGAYHEQVMNVKASAARRNDLEPLLYGLSYLLCHPEIDLDSHGGVYGWEDEDVRDIIRYMRKEIYQTLPYPNCDDVKHVELVRSSKFDWWSACAAQGLHPPDLRIN